jgi:3-hydroxybutyryl-CoA dehydrogenase
MTILSIGEASQVEEVRTKFGENHEVLAVVSQHDARPLLGKASIVFDFIIEEDPSQIQFYAGCTAPVFLNSVKASLKSIISDLAPADVQFFGFNGLATFVARPILEISNPYQHDQATLVSLMQALDTKFEVTDDRPGMISARVVSMIINEAFCAIEDGTALPADIDLAMKLGTNYPLGPVEWGRKIGLRNVCDVLAALFRETSDERYLVCELLREEANRE